VAKKKTAGEVFALVRRGWEENYGDDWNFRRIETEDDDRTLGRPVAVFADRAAAEARKGELEQEARDELNPFLFLNDEEYLLEEVTSRTQEEFIAAVKKLFPKVRLPRAGKYGQRDWIGWWDKLAGELNEEQRQAIWGLLDRLEFYGIVPIEAE
jgi:hypothetical protein